LSNTGSPTLSSRMIVSLMGILIDLMLSSG